MWKEPETFADIVHLLMVFGQANTAPFTTRHALLLETRSIQRERKIRDTTGKPQQFVNSQSWSDTYMQRGVAFLLCSYFCTNYVSYHIDNATLYLHSSTKLRCVLWQWWASCSFAFPTDFHLRLRRQNSG